MKAQTARVIRRRALALGAGLMFASASVTAALAADGKALFEKNCVSCHGTSGKGDGPAGQFLNPKPADFSKVLKGQTDEFITKVIKEGGKSVGKSPLMAPMGKKLNDEQIKAVVSYIKGFEK